MKKEHRIIQVHDISIVGENIKRLRKQQKIKQIDFVAKLQLMNVDITAYALCKIESGNQNPTVSLLTAATHLLGCDYNALFRPIDEPGVKRDEAPAACSAHYRSSPHKHE